MPYTYKTFEEFARHASDKSANMMCVYCNCEYHDRKTKKPTTVPHEHYVKCDKVIAAWNKIRTDEKYTPPIIPPKKPVAYKTFTLFVNSLAEEMQCQYCDSRYSYNYSGRQCTVPSKHYHSCKKAIAAWNKTRPPLTEAAGEMVDTVKTLKTEIAQLKAINESRLKANRELLAKIKAGEEALTAEKADHELAVKGVDVLIAHEKEKDTIMIGQLEKRNEELLECIEALKLGMSTLK